MVILCNLDELETLARNYRAKTIKIGLCHGCFDIVYSGHIDHLQQARSQVDKLFVSVTADSYVFKGVDRPIFSSRRRAEFLDALRYCDHVIINHASTAERVIHALRPDIFFKGADYNTAKDSRLEAECSLVESYGGRFVFTDNSVLDATSQIENLFIRNKL